MNILIIHQNFPGQFRNITLHLARNGHAVSGIGESKAPGLQGIPLTRYQIKSAPAPHHRFLGTVTSGAQRGEVVGRILAEHRTAGHIPDVILAHPGWGEALYVKDVFPDTRLVSFFEFYYRTTGADVGFEPGSIVNFDTAATLCSRNMLHLMNLERCDAGISPTNWQKSLHPEHYHPKIAVAHEGIDTDVMHPNSQAEYLLPDGRALRHGDKVVTYVARHLEPYRGFHKLMEALPDIQGRHRDAVTVIVGGDSVSYGRAPKGAKCWREKLLAEYGPRLDLSRVYFTGQIPYAQYRSLLQVSAAHVYLTYPFVLSWSMLEAMSCGCLVLGSATAPVQEVICHGRNGLLFDFFNPAGLAETVAEALEHPREYAPLREAARATVLERFGIAHGIQSYRALLGLPPCTI